MSAVVADTHTILWYLSADARLSRRAKEAMEGATSESEPIYVPTICIVEATYLTEKKRIELHALARLRRALRQPDSAFEPVPLTADIAFTLAQVSRSEIPDMPDRIIAATALALGLPLVTQDSRIRASQVETIW